MASKNIAKRPNGKWRARYRDEAGKEHSRHFDRKVDAQKWLDEVTATIVTGLYVDPNAGKITFKKFYDEWSERQLWVDGTRIAADQAVASVPFGDVPLRSLQRSHVEQWVKTMSDRLADSTVRTRYNYVAIALRGAVKDKRIATSPADGIRLPQVDDTDVALLEQIPTSEQVARALDAATGGFRAYVALCAFAGHRQGEVNGQQLGDIDFLRRKISIERQIQGQTRATTIVVPPKKGSKRIVSAPDELTAILSDHVATYGTRGDEEWLFGTDQHRLNRNSSGNLWRNLRAKVGMEAHTLHDLRHFFASGLIAEGCDVVQVQRALGHRSPSITLDVYTHLWPNKEEQTRKAAAAVARGVLAASKTLQSVGQGSGATP